MGTIIIHNMDRFLTCKTGPTQTIACKNNCIALSVFLLFLPLFFFFFSFSFFLLFLSLVHSPDVNKIIQYCLPRYQLLAWFLLSNWVSSTICLEAGFPHGQRFECACLSVRTLAQWQSSPCAVDRWLKSSYWHLLFLVGLSKSFAILDIIFIWPVLTK